jgi:hypothetical protein
VSVFVTVFVFVLLSVPDTAFDLSVAVLVVSVAPAKGDRPKTNAIAAVVIITFFIASSSN